MQSVTLGKEWEIALESVVHSESFGKLMEFIGKEYEHGTVFPKESDIFKAFLMTPLSKVNVVILGQDPYHDEGQAMGLSFSVPNGTKVPPSLRNMYKEIESDCGVVKDKYDDSLEEWAKQGVLLLNSILTVAEHAPSSHKGKGWENFTDSVIRVISDKQEHVVFMLWGNYARSKKILIDEKKHLILEAPHPSPFSARTGFIGCKHFSTCNLYLKKYNKQEIIW